MSDIERAIEKYKQYLEDYEENEVSINERKRWKLCIAALEKQLNGGWIPVADRLPNKAGKYICTVKFEDTSIGTYPVWFHNGIRTDILWEMDDYEVNVIAWQSLPEPYKGE